jgi:Mg2+ and Co2+ transporter CorA
MISRYTHHGLTWIDLESPSREELLHICEEFGLAKHIEETLFSVSSLQTVDIYDTCVYLSLNCPAVNGNGRSVSIDVLTVIIGKKYLITARQGSIEAIKAFGSVFEQVEKPEHYNTPTDGTMLFAELMKHVYIIALKDLQELRHRIQTVERALFNGNDGQLLQGIFQISRTLLSFQQAIASHAVVISSCISACRQCFGEDAASTAKYVSDEQALVYAAIEAEHVLLASLQQAHASRLTAKNNTRLKTLIILAIIIILLTLTSLLI